MPFGNTIVKSRSAMLALLIPNGTNLFNKIFYYNASNANDFNGKIITEMKGISVQQVRTYNGLIVADLTDPLNNFYLTLNDPNNESLFVDYPLSTITVYGAGDAKAVNQFGITINWNRSYIKSMTTASAATNFYILIQVTYLVK